MILLWATVALSPSAYVDPFIGTSGGGACYPAAQAPFGMMQLGPDTRKGNGGANYVKGDTFIKDFSLTHIDGTGLEAAADLPFMPFTGHLPDAPKTGREEAFRSRYADESAGPGRYGVTLSEPGIRVDLATTTRAGIVRFAYKPEAEAGLLFDPSRAAKGVDDADVEIDPSKREIRGWARGGGFTGKERYTIYYCARFDRTIHDSRHTARGKDLWSTLSFGHLSGPLTMKVGMSFVSTDAARKNLDAEIPGWSVDQVAAKTRDQWDRLLGRIEVKGGTESEKRMLYTALYHSCLQAGVFSDVDGQYIGFDDQIHRMPKGHRKYATFSLWDTYRTQPQLLALIAPDVVSDMSTSLLRDAQESPGRGLQSWGYYNDDTACMGTYPAPIFISNGYAFGARELDTKAMAAKFVECATSTHPRVKASSPETGGQEWWRLEDYLAKGYTEGVSETLEYAQTDMAISTLLRATGSPQAEEFLKRAQNVFNLFNPAHGYLQRRDAQGHWIEPFRPEDSEGFTEGSSSQYTWGAPQNVARLMALMGGEKKFTARLDEHLREYARTSGSWLELTRSAHWWSGNEPGFGVPFLYHWAHRPDRTQDEVRRALATCWFDRPDGLPGNDDTGAMSAWYVWSSLGLYPEIPGVGVVTLFAPRFPEVTIHLGNGKTLRLISEGEGYIVSATRDGRPLTRSWLEDLPKGGTIRLQLEAKPKDWGTHPGDEPPSFGPSLR